MALSPYLQQWAQTAEAQPYLAQVAPQYSGMSGGMGGPGMGGYGMGGGGDDYGSYLRELINANQANPQFQQQMLGQYLDYANPMNQQKLNQPMVDENKLAFAQTLLSAGPGTELYKMGMSLATEAYPQLAASGYEVETQPKTYEDLQRQQAETVLKEPEGLGRKDFDWYSFLQNASDQQIRQYEEAKNKTVGLAPWLNPYWKGTGAGNPFDASFWSPEARARAKMGYF